MTTLRRGLLNTTGLLLVALAVFYATRYWPQQMPLLPAANGKQAADTRPDYVITDFHAIDLDETGRLRYELTAATLTHYADPERALLTQPEIVFYRGKRATAQDAATIPWQLTADRGVITEQGDRVDLEGSVRVARLTGGQDQDGEGVDDAAAGATGSMTMETSHLTVHGASETAVTDAPVVLRSPLASLAATGMQVDLKQGRMSLLANVRGQYDPP